MMNVGYLTAGRNSQSDECLTPRCAVEPIVKYLKAKGFTKIWCPFDKEDSMYVRVLKKNGFNVVFTHKDIDNGDFFNCVVQCDCIVSNPLFSLKDKVLKKLYSLNVPFMILLPQNSLQSHTRTKLFMDNGLEYLGFDGRIPFYTKGINKKTGVKETEEEMFSSPKIGNHFASGYFCHNVLPQKLMFEHLDVIVENYLAYE